MLTTRTLEAPWTDNTFVISNFSDPSYSWVGKSHFAAENGKRVVLLLQADTWTLGGQRAIRHASSILFVSGKQIAGRPTMLVGFGVDLTPLAWLGTVVTPSKGEL